MYNKLNRILLSLLILNLMFWNLLLVPMQTKADTTRYSCDPETGQCFVDDNGSYTCPTACANACSNSTTPSTSSGGCGSAPITGGGTVDVYIVGWAGQSAAEAAAQEGINTLEDLANVTGLTVGLVKNKFLDLILSGLDIAWICQQLSNAATGLPWGAAAVVAQAIAMVCPTLLDNFLTELGFYKLKSPTGEMTQTIPVPTFKYYQWEIGLPGFIKPGQIIEFK